MRLNISDFIGGLQFVKNPLQLDLNEAQILDNMEVDVLRRPSLSTAQMVASRKLTSVLHADPLGQGIPLTFDEFTPISPDEEADDTRFLPFLVATWYDTSTFVEETNEGGERLHLAVVDGSDTTIGDVLLYVHPKEIENVIPAVWSAQYVDRIIWGGFYTASAASSDTISLLHWDGTLLIGDLVIGESLSSDVPACEAGIFYQDRLFTGGDIPEFGNARNRLYFSDVGDFEAFDPSNFIDIGRGDEKITKLIDMQDRLLIIKEYSIWALYFNGESPIDSVLIQTDERGCFNHYGIVKNQRNLFQVDYINGFLQYTNQYQPTLIPISSVLSAPGEIDEYLTEFSIGLGLDRDHLYFLSAELEGEDV